MSRYDTDIDISNDNTSHVQMLQLVGYNKDVLDAGCSTGYLAKALVERGCTVSGVEADPKAAEAASDILANVVVGDLEVLDLVGEFGHQAFDVVVFGDVLEHLRDPLPALRQSRNLIRPGGSIVVSIPNVGHGAVRLALLKGQWDYRGRGLLDETHLRFFTRESVTTLLESAGFCAVDFRRTTAGLFDTEVAIRPEDYPPELIEQILDDPDATTYQFVLRAVADDAIHALEDLARRTDEQRIRIHDLERQLARTRRSRDAQLDRADALGARADALEAQLDRMEQTRTLRLTRRPRAIYGRLRRLAAVSRDFFDRRSGAGLSRP